MPIVTAFDAMEKYDAGLDAFKRADYESAAELWLSAAKNPPTQVARKIADGLSAIAAANLRADTTDEATERLYIRAIELRREFLDENDESMAIEFNNFGMFYERRKDLDRAIEFLEKSVAILDTQSTLNKENLADPYDNLAAILLDRNCPDRALELCQKALEIRDKVLGKINPVSLKSLELLAEIQEAIKAHSRVARETRKELKARLVLLSMAYEKLGDPLLAQAILVSARLSEPEAREIISTSLNVLCQDFVRNRVHQ